MTIAIPILATALCFWLALPCPKAGYRDPGERGPWFVAAGIVWGVYYALKGNQ